jgi:hypothetical protein
MRYEIKTEKFNIFSGTRAEAIVSDLGTRSRTACGYLGYVLPALATMRDLDNVSEENKSAHISVAMNTLTPRAFLDERFTEEALLKRVLTDVYGIRLGWPRTNDPTILGLNIDKAEQSTVGKLVELTDTYKDSQNIFVYQDKAVADPALLLPKKLRHKDNAYCNAKGHNAFFNSFLEEILQDCGTRELVIIGEKAADQVFYTAISTVDIKPKPTVILPEFTAGRVTRQGSEILADHFRHVLSVEPTTCWEHASTGRGITIYLE